MAENFMPWWGGGHAEARRGFFRVIVNYSYVSSYFLQLRLPKPSAPFTFDLAKTFSTIPLPLLVEVRRKVQFCHLIFACQ